MFNRNQFTLGLSLGILFPLIGIGLAALIGFVWSQLATEGQTGPVRERTLVLLAICLNLIPFRAFNKRKALHSLRGVVTVTVVLAMLWIVLYFKELIA